MDPNLDEPDLYDEFEIAGDVDPQQSHHLHVHHCHSKGTGLKYPFVAHGGVELQ